MAFITVQGKRVQVSPEFFSLPPDQQDATVEEIAGSLQPQQQPQQQPSQIPAAIGDIPKEIAGEFTSGLGGIKSAAQTGLQALNPFSASRGAAYTSAANEPSFMRGLYSSLSPLLQTGKGLAAAPQAALGVAQSVASPITGIAKSLLGHGLADIEHQVGSFISPSIAEKDVPEQMYGQAKEDVGTAMLGMQPTKVGATGLKAPVPTVEEVKSHARSLYRNPEVAKVTFHPENVNDLANIIKQDLYGGQYPVDEVTAPNVFRYLSRITDQKNPVSIKHLDQTRSLLGTIAAERNDIGEATPQAIAASRARQILTDFMANPQQSHLASGDASVAGPILKAAREDWTQYYKAQDLENRMSNAQIMREGAGSGTNVNTMRQQVRPLLKDQNLHARILNYKPEEIAQAHKVVGGGTGTNLTRWTGNLISGWGTPVAGYLGAQVGGPIGASVSVAGTRAFGNALQRMAGAGSTQEAKLLSEMLLRNTPAAREMASKQKPPNPLAQLLLSGYLPSAGTTQ